MVELKNNIIFKVFLIFVVGIMLFTMIPVNVYATDGEKPKALYIDGHLISTIYYGENQGARGYWDPVPFTFSDYMNGNTKYYDGDWMALEATATSTAGVIQIHIDLLVYNTGVHHNCTIWSNGNFNKFDWIYLGGSGGSSSDNYYYVSSQYASAVNTVDVKSYSWY